jgi:V/A-type H+/Na+-transporting ATPase subunit I
MFRPVPMMRLSAVVLERDERTVLREFGRLGAVQLTRTPAGEDSAPLPPLDRGREMAACDRLKTRMSELRRTLGIEAIVGQSAPAGMTIQQAESKVAELERQAHDLMSRRGNALHRARELDSVGAQVSNLRGLDMPLDEIGQFEFLHFVAGSLPEGALEQLDSRGSAALLPLPVSAGRQPLLALTTKSRAAALDDSLKRAGFQAEKLPPAAGATADELLAATEREQEQVNAGLGQLRQKLEALAAGSARTLDELEASVDAERRLLEAEQSCPRTEAAVLITGWIPEPAVREVRENLLRCSGGRCAVEVLPPGDVPEDDIPVLLRHSRLLRPFEMLMSAYGLPRYRELAPTLFVATSYVLMFGMMFGDVGHGSLLALGGAALVLKSRVARVRDFGVLFIFNGVCSAAFGAAYGSYFGIPRFKEHALWHDPLEGNPMELMWLAIATGIVLMSIGLLLNIVNHLHRRDWMDGVLGKFGIMGIVFYWGALALVAKAAEIRAQGWWTLALGVFLGMPIVCWALKEPLAVLLRRRPEHGGGGGMAAAITESLVSAFEGVLLYLANTVSFVRLAAYAMSHAALLMVTFMLAAEVGRLGAGGPVLSVLVAVLGNLVTIVLEGIVASVQALRLEYYEFFGKFFSGEGKPYKPFSLAVPSA